MARFVGQDPRAVDVIRTLVKAGANVNISGAHGTALELVPEAHRGLVADVLAGAYPPWRMIRSSIMY